PVRGAVDGDVADPGVHHAHEVVRLVDVRAVLAADRVVGLERVLALEPADLIEHLGLDLRRMAADPQHGEDERGQLVAERHAGEAHRDVGAGPDDGEGRAALVVVPADDGDLVGERGDLVEEGGELARRVAVVERGDELDGVADVLEVRPELRGDGVVQHRSSRCGAWRGVRQGERKRKGPTATGPATGRGQGRPHRRRDVGCRVVGRQILPTRSSDGARVSSPSSHLAGHTSFGCSRTYWAALILRSSSTALRPTPSEVISISWMTPSGSITKVARSARPWPSRITSKFRVISPVGSPIIGNWTLAMVSEASCQALWVKWVSV